MIIIMIIICITIIINTNIIICIIIDRGIYIHLTTLHIHPFGSYIRVARPRVAASL